MKALWEKLKNRLGISNNIQVVVILFVFALSGFSTLFLHNYIDGLLGINDGTAFWIRALVFAFLVLPIFNLFLIVWATILGQQSFFIKFIKLKIFLIVGWMRK